MKNIAIFGATGSIGKQTVEVVLAHPDKFAVTTVTANSSVNELAQTAIAVGAKKAVIADESLYDQLKEALTGTNTEVAAGKNALINAAVDDSDIIMAAMVGNAGLQPLLAAIKSGKNSSIGQQRTVSGSRRNNNACCCGKWRDNYTGG